LIRQLTALPQAGLFPEAAPQCSGFGQVMRWNFEFTKIMGPSTIIGHPWDSPRKVKFSADSLLEEDGFELAAPAGDQWAPSAPACKRKNCVMS
jgi:hypothetical protein